MDFKINNYIENSWLHLVLNSRLDFEESQLLEKKLNDCFFKKLINVQIDLKNLDVLHSSGIRVLLSMKKNFLQNNRKFILSNIPDHVLNIIKIAGFDKHLLSDKEKN